MALTLEERQFYFGRTEIKDEADYDSNGNFIYEGYAIAGTAESASRWLIMKHTYDGSNRWTGKKRLWQVAWSDRATLTFT